MLHRDLHPEVNFTEHINAFSTHTHVVSENPAVCSPFFRNEELAQHFWLWFCFHLHTLYPSITLSILRYSCSNCWQQKTWNGSHLLHNCDFIQRQVVSVFVLTADFFQLKIFLLILECIWHYTILTCENPQQLHCSWNIRKVKSLKTKDAALQTMHEILMSLKSVLEFKLTLGKPKNYCEP